MTDNPTECATCGHRACTRGRNRQTNKACPSCTNGTCVGYLDALREAQFATRDDIQGMTDREYADHVARIVTPVDPPPDIQGNSCGSTRPHGPHRWEDHTRTESCAGNLPSEPPANPPADEYRCMSEQPHPPHDITRSWSDTPLRCPGRPPAGRQTFLCNTCGGGHDTVDERRTCVGPAAAAPGTDPPADWLAVWFAGHLAGYATGYEHGHADGEHEYGASLQAALKPLRRAAAHGIDVMMARRAWENQRRAEHGMPPLTGPLERGGDREPYPEGGDQDV